ncbi:MAG: TRIC cation channel family protein [Candidatus Tumulicola sp.]
MTPLILSQYGFATLGTLGVISLIAATTNAFNGALLARRPDHYKHFTLIGVIILAYAGGIGGGIVRDVLVNKIPSPLVNPWYLIACFVAAGVALLIDLNSATRFKDGLFQFMTAFSLPWYAIVGAQAALAAHLGYAAAVVLGVIATTAGRWIIDIACQVVPKQLVRGEFFVTAAALTGAAYLVCDQAFGLPVIASTAIAFFVGFGFRLASQAFGWEEWEPWEPAGLEAAEKVRSTLGAGLKKEFGGDTGPKAP